MIFPKFPGIVEENACGQEVEIEIRIERRDRGRDAHHLRGELNQSASSWKVITTGNGRIAKAGPMLRDEFLAQGMQTWIANCSRRRDDEFPIGRLSCPQLGWPLQKLRLLFSVELARRPASDIEPVLLVLIEFAGDLDELAALERIASLIVGMIAPHPQRHAIARIGQTELAIGLLFTR